MRGTPGGARSPGYAARLARTTCACRRLRRASSTSGTVVIRPPGRDALAALAAAGIETLIHYGRRPTGRPPTASRPRPGLPADRRGLAAEMLSLPIDPLLSDAQVEAVIEATLDWDRARSARPATRWTRWVATRERRAAGPAAASTART